MDIGFQESVKKKSILKRQQQKNSSNDDKKITKRVCQSGCGINKVWYNTMCQHSNAVYWNFFLPELRPTEKLFNEKPTYLLFFCETR